MATQKDLGIQVVSNNGQTDHLAQTGQPAQGQSEEPKKELTRLIQTWIEESKGRPPVIVTAGKSGVGKSTMINNFLELERDEECLTGDDADATTTEVKLCEKRKNGLLLKLIDTPGVGGIRKADTKNVLKQLSILTEGRADILLYCISLHSSAKPDAGDVEIIKMLNSAFGYEVWKHTILVLTFANLKKSKSKELYRTLIEGYATHFQNALRAAKVKKVEVKSVFSENADELKEVIPAVPVSEKPHDQELPLGKHWSDMLLVEILNHSEASVALQLLKWKELLSPGTTDTVAEISGSIMAGVAVGAAVGAAGGVPLSIPGLAVGVSIGAVIGGIAGGLGRLVPHLRHQQEEKIRRQNTTDSKDHQTKSEGNTESAAIEKTDENTTQPDGRIASFPGPGNEANGRTEEDGDHHKKTDQKTTD